MNRSEHPSDDPGGPTRRGSVQHPSSGASGSNPPRRPGTGSRQAERRHYVGDQPDIDEPMIPGEVLYVDEPVRINTGKPVTTLRVANTADRPVQVGSHFHFAEANAALEFDREAAWGRRLNIMSGGSVRFEPGAVEEVELIPIGGRRIVRGLRGLCGGALDG
ncbi:urease subunit beta [Streptomyces sp. NWU339]|uniref:urease subunit beta n=1 Tax=Streptomyces sp. NWU339 TaxID=2185284 RepID=UPI00268C598F|nr:urease subunit beta [Streptomyces sp. NWU339]